MITHLQKYRLDFLLMALIVIIGAAMLLFRIGQVPPLFPWSDESEVASDAVASLKSGLQLIYPIQRSGGSIGVWVETGWMALFGKDLLGLRIFNGLINLASALFLYLLVRQMPFKEFSNVADKRWLSATAALLFAVSTWLLGLARIATPNWSMVPLMTSLAFFLFWLGLNTNRWGYFVAAGAVMGLFLYGYLPGYLVVSVPAIFLVLVWLLKLDSRQFCKPAFCLLTFPAALVVAFPALLYFIQNPILVTNRPIQLVNNSELAESDSMIQGGLDMLSTFGLLPNWLLQGNFEHLVFDPVATIFFVTGLLLAVWRWKDPAHLFLIIWWGVMLAPAVLSKSASEGFIFEVWRRGVGAQPASFILAALGLAGVARWLHRKWLARFNKTVFFGLTTSAVLIISAAFSYQLYFKQWANNPAIPLLFAQTPVNMVEWMEDSAADTLFLYPMRPNVSYTTRPELFTVRYLFDGPAQAAFPKLNEDNVNQDLADLLDTHQPKQIKLMLPQHITVDPKGYFEYALAAVGEVTAHETLFGFNVTTFTVNNLDAPDIPFAPSGIPFGDALQLAGYKLESGRPAAGETMGVALQWRKTNNDAVTDYSAGLALFDDQGYEIAKVDKPLLNGNHLTTRHWSPGDEAAVYYALPIPPDAPPGLYTLRLVAYNTESGAQLAPAGGLPDLSLPLAELDLQLNPNPIDSALLTIAQPIGTRFPNGLHLLGAETDATIRQRPGDSLRVTLLWQAAEPVANNIGLMLALAQPDRNPIPLYEQPQPLIAGYPVSKWPVDQIYRANYRITFPPPLDSGDYQLALGLIDLDTRQPIAEQLLGPVTVEARAHVFEAPALTHQLNADFSATAGRKLIRLLGFEPVEPESSQFNVAVKLQWQALQSMPESYKVFLHLVDSSGQIISQIDMRPQQGAAPTTGWLPGEIIEDTLTLPRPADTGSGPYQVILGVYNETSGQRLRSGQQDYVILLDQIQ